MPSGMPYYRALPLTYLNAAILKVSDPGSEASYRAASAFFGAATLVILFLGARAYFGFSVAIVACCFMLLSDWHIALSREGRM